MRDVLHRSARFVIACLFLGASAPLVAGFASNEVYLASIGRGAGSGGAQFFSTVWVTNLSSSATVHFTFFFLKDGRSNLSGAPSFSDTLAPGQTKLYENVTETKLNLPGQFGAARITADGEIFASERVYDLAHATDNLGTSVGLFFAAVPKTFAIGQGETASIQGVNQGSPTENMRSNFDLVETTGNSCTVHVTLLDQNGTAQGATDVNMVPFGHVKQSAQALLHSIATINDRIVATVTSGSGKVILAGEQLANTSQDSSGFEMSFKDSLLGGNTGGNCSLCVTSLNGLTGAVTIAHGANTTVNVSGQTVTIDAIAGSGTGLTAVAHDNTLAGSGTASTPLGIAAGGVGSSQLAGGAVGSSQLASGAVQAGNVAAGQVVKSVNGLHDDVALAAGSNVTILPSGNLLTINAAAGGLTLPFSGTISLLSIAFDVANNSSVGIRGSGGGGFPGVLGLGATGIEGQANGVAGVGVLGQASASQGTGVKGFGGSGGTGVLGDGGNSGTGLMGTGSTGVDGESTVGKGFGVFGKGFVGVSGTTTSIISGSAGIIGSAPSGGIAAAFDGNVNIVGHLSKTSGSFKIDHPLDPANKFLYHSFVESPDMKNIYDGLVRLDANGEAVVELPEWFGALNQDFRYQLTCLGGFAPVWIEQEIAGNRFVIKGTKPGLKISWQVTGVRHDAWAEAHRVPVEVEKNEDERGRYIHPELFGAPKESSLSYREPPVSRE